MKTTRPLAEIEIENLEAEYWMGMLAEVQNLPRLAVLNEEILRLRDEKLRAETGMTE